MTEPDIKVSDGHPGLTTYDMFQDDEPIVASCDLENPELCEACD